MYPTLDQLLNLLPPLVDQAFDSLGDIRSACKEDGSVVTALDTQLQSEIETTLQTHWPEVSFLGEEMSRKDQTVRLAAAPNQAIWVLDPLDGTSNFSTGIPLFGVSLALVREGAAELAVVYDPIRKECYYAERGKGAYLNGEQLQASTQIGLDECIANVDYKRLTRDLASQLVTCPPYRSQRNIGTCVLEWCWLAAGRIQLYLHGGQQLWDHAAGYLILLEAGGMAKTITGEDLRCDVLGKQSAVAAASPQLFDLWRDWIALQEVSAGVSTGL